MSQGVVQCFLSCTDISQVNFHYSCYTGSMEILTTNPFQKMLCDEGGGGGGGGGSRPRCHKIVGVSPMPICFQLAWPKYKTCRKNTNI